MRHLRKKEADNAKLIEKLAAYDKPGRTPATAAHLQARQE